MCCLTFCLATTMACSSMPGFLMTNLAALLANSPRASGDICAHFFSLWALHPSALIHVAQHPFRHVLNVWNQKACSDYEMAARSALCIGMVKSPSGVSALIEVNMCRHTQTSRLYRWVAHWTIERNHRRAAPEADALTARLGYLCWRPGWLRIYLLE